MNQVGTDYVEHFFLRSYLNLLMSSQLTLDVSMFRQTELSWKSGVPGRYRSNSSVP